MSEKWSFAKKLGKNICAFVLAISAVTGLISETSFEADAVDYGIWFKSGNYTGVTTDNTQMICDSGENLSILANLPRSLTLPINNKAFRVLQGSDEKNDHFSIDGSTSNGQGAYVLTPNPDVIGLTDTEPSRSYTLEANYQATGVFSGSGSAVSIGEDENGDDYRFPDNGVDATISGDNGFSLTEDTHIALKFEKIQGALVGKVTASSGYLASRFPSGVKNVATITENGTNSYIVALSHEGYNLRFDVKFSTGTVALNALQALDLTLYFKRPTYNTPILEMVTPKKALEADIKSLNAGYDAAVMEDSITPYFKLSDGDAMNGIKGRSISVKTQVPRYNSKQIGVEWGWIPITGSDNSSGNPYKNLVTWNDQVMIVNEPTGEDVTGFLTARFYYQPKGQGEDKRIYLSDPAANEWDVKMEIRVLGRGIQPTLLFTSGEYMNRAADGKWSSKEKSYSEAEQVSRNIGLDLYDGKPEPAPSNYNPLNRNDSYDLAPFHIRGSINFGTSRNAASSFSISRRQSGGNGDVRLNFKGSDYTWDQKMPLNRDNISNVLVESFDIYATEEGTIDLTFHFYSSTGEEMLQNVVQVHLTISDTRPSDDPTLKKMDMLAVFAEDGDPQSIKTFQEMYSNKWGDLNVYTDYELANALDSEQGHPAKPTEPIPIILPNIVEKIRLRPQYFDGNNQNSITIEAEGRTYEVDPKSTNIFTNPPSLGQATEEIPLQEGVTIIVTVHGVAQSGQKGDYVLRITRAKKDSNAKLADLVVKPTKNSDIEYKLEPDNDPFNGDWLNYTVHIPYRQEKVYVEAIAENPWASKIEILANPDAPTPLLARLAQAVKRYHGDNFEVKYIEDEDGNISNVTELTIQVTAEDGQEIRTYKLKLIKDPPSEDATMIAPEVSYWLASDKRTEIPIELDGGFYPDESEIFTKLVEYSTNQVRLKLTPNDYRAANITVELLNRHEVQQLPHEPSGEEAQAIPFTFKNVKDNFDENNQLRFQVTVEAEKPGVVTSPPYIIIVERKEPSRDLTADVTLTNMLTNAAIDFGYTNVIDSYPEKEVEYTPGDMKVLVQVKPKDTKTTVQVQGNSPRPDGTAVSLTAGSATTVTIVLTAEDGSTRTITIPLKYKGPSNAAYLSNLTAGGLKFLPDPTPFDKKKTSYKIEIPKGTTTLPVTATLLKDGSKDDSSNATITIEGVTVKDGEAFNYQPTDKTGKITIVVTAQDGKTKRTYTITYKNWNLLIPNDEDTLKDLWVDYGDMQPEFSPAVTEYDVYVKPDAMDLKIYPKLKDKDGDIEVTAESKVLTKFEDYYSTSLMDDEMDIHIYVWSEKAVVESASSNTNTDTANAKPARSAAREYILHVYRNDDEKIGNLKPVTAEMVDFTSADPIVIDITKYTVISADVFNTLKTDYADKSIIFKGNDYTLQVFGADIDGLVPNADSFDLKFSFRTPDEDKILDLIDDTGRNGNVDPVYYYFNQHGALPAEMLLTVDLGRHYRNTELYWNYYNKERERIDYYGYVHTNAKGTFSVPISHFSTYMTTDDKIRGAENKSDEYGNPALTPETENLNAPGSTDKAIPNTGAGVAG